MRPWEDNKDFLIIVAILLAAITGSAQYAGAQESVRTGNFGAGNTVKTPEVQEETIGKFSTEEYKALNRSEGAHNRIKTYIRLASIRLKNARELLDMDDYSGADEQIQVYTALVAEAGRFRETSVGPYDKANKTLEQGLFEQLRVLDSIRRNTISKYFEGADQAYILATRVRLQSLGALLGTGKSFLPRSEKRLRYLSTSEVPQG
jgi:hypothetical protein